MDPRLKRLQELVDKWNRLGSSYGDFGQCAAELADVLASPLHAGAKPKDWEGDLPTEHPNRCKLRDNLLYSDMFNDDGSHRRAWRCHKREGHDGPCSSHNDCGVMSGGVVCGHLPGHAGPHAWETRITLHAGAEPEEPRALTRSRRDVTVNLVQHTRALAGCRGASALEMLARAKAEPDPNNAAVLAMYAGSYAAEAFTFARMALDYATHLGWYPATFKKSDWWLTGPKAAALSSSRTAPQIECPNGVHVWSNQFGDDWTPDVGTPCDCRKKQWGRTAPEGPKPDGE